MIFPLPHPGGNQALINHQDLSRSEAKDKTYLRSRPYFYEGSISKAGKVPFLSALVLLLRQSNLVSLNVIGQQPWKVREHWRSYGIFKYYWTDYRCSGKIAVTWCQKRGNFGLYKPPIFLSSSLLPPSQLGLKSTSVEVKVPQQFFKKSSSEEFLNTSSIFDTSSHKFLHNMIIFFLQRFAWS